MHLKAPGCKECDSRAPHIVASSAGEQCIDCRKQNILARCAPQANLISALSIAKDQGGSCVDVGLPGFLQVCSNDRVGSRAFETFHERS